MSPRAPREIDGLIEEILASGEIADQRTLLARLAERGVRLAQPTLSRRLERMGVRKVRGRYRKVSAEERHAALPDYRLVACPPNMLLARTEAGFAQALALRIDRLAIEGVLGTVAGDDTVLVAVGGVDLGETATRLARALKDPADLPAHKAVSEPP